MKKLDAVFDDPSSPPGERRGSARRSAKSAEPVLDVNARSWPAVAVPQHSNISALEETIAKQSAELNLRCTQVADLYNVQQRQANELQIACEEIDRLSGTISTLLEKTAQQEADAEAATKQIALLESEKAALRAQLDKTLARFL